MFKFKIVLININFFNLKIWVLFKDAILCSKYHLRANFVRHLE